MTGPRPPPGKVVADPMERNEVFRASLVSSGESGDHHAVVEIQACLSGLVLPRLCVYIGMFYQKDRISVH